MKKVLLIALAVGLFALPVMAQVESGAGKVTIHACIDFLGKYIAEDKDNGVKQVEDFIIRDTILSLQGELSDKVSWELTSLWTAGTPVVSYTLNGSTLDPTTTYQPGPVLLTAKIDLKLIPMTTISVGRFLPDQSPALQYHILSNVHTIYFPMLVSGGPSYGGGENTALVLAPSFQTGVQAKVGNETVHVSLGWFNGIQPQLDSLTGAISTPGISNFSETDNSKAGLVKVGLTTKGIIAGASWWDEYANNLQKTGGTEDLRLTIYDAYVGYKHDKFHVLAEYAENNLDPLGKGAKDIKQSDWYVQAGVSPIKALEVVARYEVADQFDLAKDDYNDDEEAWTTIGLNYFLVEKNAAVALQYIIKDHDGLEYNTNEWGLLFETSL